MSITLTASLMATLSSALRIIVGLSCPSSAFFNSISIYSPLILSLLTKYCKFLSILTETFCVLVDLPFAFGSNKSNAFGEFAVSMKNINNRNTISVIEDMLKSGLTLFLPFSFTLLCYVLLIHGKRNKTASLLESKSKTTKIYSLSLLVLFLVSYLLTLF